MEEFAAKKIEAALRDRPCPSCSGCPSNGEQQQQARPPCPPCDNSNNSNSNNDSNRSRGAKTGCSECACRDRSGGSCMASSDCLTLSRRGEGGGGGGSAAELGTCSRDEDADRGGRRQWCLPVSEKNKQTNKHTRFCSLSPRFAGVRRTPSNETNDSLENIEAGLGCELLRTVCSTWYVICCQNQRYAGEGRWFCLVLSYLLS